MGRDSDTIAADARAALFINCAARIEDLREALDITVSDLADRIDVGVNQLWEVLNGGAPLTVEVAARALREMANVILYREAVGELVSHHG